MRPIASAAAEVTGVSAAFAAAWARRPAAPAVLAVSGGSDSTALLRLVAASGATPPVVTVDHGLREDSATEAAGVARLCSALGLAHVTLAWRHRAAAGNLQAAAREARYRLIADWAVPRGIGTIVTGHTLDDQAETVLMRLARGSGVDGLAAMRETGHLGEMTLFRPLLGLGRGALRDHLRSLGQAWVEDPSNADRRFDRVKAREALRHLAPLGLTPERLARTAEHMARAADALEAVLDGWAATEVDLRPTGEARIARAAWAGLPDELRLRLLARVLGAVSGQVYRPRFDALAPLDGALRDPVAAGRALHGCLIRPEPDVLLIVREPAAVAPPRPIGSGGADWDGRWRVWPEHAPMPTGLTLGALGEDGLAALDPATVSADWQAAPRLARQTTPAVWHGRRLVAAPLAGSVPAAGWCARRLSPGE